MELLSSTSSNIVFHFVSCQSRCSGSSLSIVDSFTAPAHTHASSQQRHV